MNWDQITENWKEWRLKIKEQWVELADDDLSAIRGRRDRMINLLQEKYGFTKGPAERALNEFLNGLEARSLADGRLQPP